MGAYHPTLVLNFGIFVSINSIASLTPKPVLPDIPLKDVGLPLSALALNTMS